MKYVVVFLFLLSTSAAMAGQNNSIYLLTNADANSLYGSFQYALEKSPNHQAVDWVNPASGLSGSTVPIRSYKTSYGQTCREYLSTVQLDGATQQAFGTACQQSAGNWKIAGEKPVKRSPQMMKFVYVKQQAGQLQLRCPFVMTHPPLKQAVQQPLHRNRIYPDDHFHEKFQHLKQGRESFPEPRQKEPQQPSKLIKLVIY